ncbi:MAG: bifunctional diaminohydroxyphosphoribosylaminopyrimidine deaminase/5-amino-6-(5-phosphoribosylamino)uracil reductase RibD [Desulfobacterales bacterium]
MNHDDRHYMKTALALAEKGLGYTSPNPMVGAVLVKGGRIIGKGYHEFVGGPHAEINAIAHAGEDLRGAVLYVTLEPCNHTGRTGPCTEKIVSSGIGRVVTAMKDPNPTVAGNGNDYLRRRGVAVTEGVCRKEAERLNEAFIKFVHTRRPFVTLKCAATLDGRIATRTGDSKWISNAVSREYVHRLRHAADAIMVGIGTVVLDNPSLTTRLKDGINGRKGRDPIRIILDSSLSIDENATVLTVPYEAPAVLVIQGERLNDEKRRKRDRLAKRGIRFIDIPMKGDRMDLDVLMDRLGEMNIMTLLVEGGSRIIQSALSENIIDKVMFFYGPKLLGGNDGIPMIAGNGPEKMADCIRIRDIQVRRFGDDIMVSGYPVH